MSKKWTSPSVPWNTFCTEGRRGADPHRRSPMRVAERVSPEVRRDWLPRAIVAGFIAAVVMSFTFMLAYGLAYLVARWQPLRYSESPANIAGWFYALIHNPATDLAGSNLYVSGGLHFLVAIAWAVLYAYAAEPRLHGPAWRRGVTFSLLPWLLSIIVLLPLVGGGPLGVGLGAGPLPVLGNLILHAVYGATLGVVYGPFGDIPADRLSSDGPAADVETARTFETNIDDAAVGGLAVGAL